MTTKTWTCGLVLLVALLAPATVTATADDHEEEPRDHGRAPWAGPTDCADVDATKIPPGFAVNVCECLP